MGRARLPYLSRETLAGVHTPEFVADLHGRLSEALAGTGPAITPELSPELARELERQQARRDAAGEGPIAIVVGTSGSTGNPKLAMLTREAVIASAQATHERLGGPGSWFLAVPPTHIAGLQVIARTVVAGTQLAALDVGNGLDPEAFAQAAAAQRRQTSGRRYATLVPAGLNKLMGHSGARTELAAFNAVLVGGAATSPTIRRSAEAAGIRITTTYGMSETCAGCVYDGRPLSGVEVALEPDGRIRISSPSLALGYLGQPELSAEVFTQEEGKRWFRTDDLGTLSEGIVSVVGRRDDLINTGSLKVAPQVVEDALVQLPQIQEACVVGLPDEHWGQIVAAAVTTGQPTDSLGLPLTLAQVREQLRGVLPKHALPQALRTLDALPLRGPGKPDRAAVKALFIAEMPAMSDSPRPGLLP